MSEPLSRRDKMIVARHEMPGKCQNMIRPVGNGVIDGARVYAPSKTIGHGRQPIIPYPPGRAYQHHVSRHFMPGYHLIVPTGQTVLRPMLTHGELPSSASLAPGVHGIVRAFH